MYPDTTQQVSRPTFRYSILAFTPVATPTDVIQLIGSASKTIRIKHITIFGSAAAAGSMNVQLIRRSTIGTIGSAVVTAIVPAKLDKNDVAATASVGSIGTANWTTPGTSAGVIESGLLTFSNAGATQNPLLFDFTTRQDKPLILRGTSDWVYLNFNGEAVPTTGKLDITIETEEDDS